MYALEQIHTNSSTNMARNEDDCLHPAPEQQQINGAISQHRHACTSTHHSCCERHLLRSGRLVQVSVMVLRKAFT